MFEMSSLIKLVSLIIFWPYRYKVISNFTRECGKCYLVIVIILYIFFIFIQILILQVLP